jgi:hypothetical protein
VKKGVNFHDEKNIFCNNPISSLFSPVPLPVNRRLATGDLSLSPTPTRTPLLIKRRENAYES